MTKFFFFGIQARIYHTDFVWTPSKLAYTVVPLMPVLLLGTAAMLNLNNWILVYLKVEEVSS